MSKVVRNHEYGGDAHRYLESHRQFGKIVVTV
jgi:hypothetical protein